MSYGGREGLFDDVVGRGWQLLLFHNSQNSAYDRPPRKAIHLPDAVAADFTPEGDTVDLDGTYASWFARLGAEAVLVRPDFYIFGTSSAAGVNTLLASAEHLYKPDVARSF